MAETDPINQPEDVSETLQVETTTASNVDLFSRPWVVEQPSPEISADGGSPPDVPKTTEAPSEPGNTSDKVAETAETAETTIDTSPRIEDLQKQSEQVFTQERQVYLHGIRTPDGINYVLERYSREAQQKGSTDNPFDPLSPESAAALMLRIDELSAIPADAGPNEQLRHDLQQRINEDPAAAKLFYTERYAALTQEGTAQEIAVTAEAITAGESVAGHQLRILLEKSNELTALEGERLPNGFAENLSKLQEEYKKRGELCGRVAEVVKSMDGEIEVDLNALFVGTDKAVQVSAVQREGETLTVTTTTDEGAQIKTEIKKPDTLKLLLVMLVSDSLLGTKNLEKAAGHIVLMKLSPLLEKWGIDPTLFLDTMNYGRHEVIDQVFETMTDAQREQFFTNSMENGSLPAVLEQCNPDHRKKIFNPNGTQRFGSTSFLGIDKYLLPQELVDKMYSSLTARQREDLRIPEKKAGL